MKIKHLFTAVMLIFFSIRGFSQDSLLVDTPTAGELPVVEEEEEEQDYKPYDALAPSRAAFYSAILPGLGQAFNGSYWKIPIAYGGLGIGVYFYINNDNEFNRFRDAYKDRLAGRVDEFTANGQDITDDGLIRGQRFYRRNKEISILVIAGIYALNIIDANVEAHLQQFNVSEDLTLRPNMNFDEFSGKTRYGLSLNYNF